MSTRAAAGPVKRTVSNERATDVTATTVPPQPAASTAAVLRQQPHDQQHAAAVEPRRDSAAAKLQELEDGIARMAIEYQITSAVARSEAMRDAVRHAPNARQMYDKALASYGSSMVTEPLTNRITICPPAAMTAADAERITQALEDLLEVCDRWRKEPTAAG